VGVWPGWVSCRISFALSEGQINEMVGSGRREEWVEVGLVALHWRSIEVDLIA